jgi:predicted Zn finger-like uncharacterized protein
MPMIQIDCPSCGHSKEISSDKLPQTDVVVICPQCNNRFNYCYKQKIPDFIFHNTLPREDNAPPPAPPTLNPSTADMHTWLNSIGLGEHINAFDINNVYLHNLHSITETDLISMGISSVGHRKLLLNGIEKHVCSNKTTDSVQQFAYLQLLYFIVLVVADLIIFNIDATFGWKLSISFGLMILTYIYFLPTSIAFKKGNEYRWAIFIVNTFFGVSFVGWIIALIVAMGWMSGQTGAVLAVLAPNGGLSKN